MSTIANIGNCIFCAANACLTSRSNDEHRVEIRKSSFVNSSHLLNMVHFENVRVSLVRMDPYHFFLPHVMHMDPRRYGYEDLVKSIQFKHLRKFLVKGF